MQRHTPSTFKVCLYQSFLQNTPKPISSSRPIVMSLIDLRALTAKTILTFELPDTNQEFFAQVHLTEFHLFPLLPVELRLKIWRLILPRPRPVSFDNTSHFSDRSIPQSFYLSYVESIESAVQRHAQSTKASGRPSFATQRKKHLNSACSWTQ